MTEVQGVTELAKVLEVNPSTVYRWCKRGLPYEAGRNRRIFILEIVKAWLKRQA